MSEIKRRLAERRASVVRSDASSPLASEDPTVASYQAKVDRLAREEAAQSKRASPNAPTPSRAKAIAPRFALTRDDLVRAMVLGSILDRPLALRRPSRRP